MSKQIWRYLIVIGVVVGACISERAIGDEPSGTTQTQIPAPPADMPIVFDKYQADLGEIGDDQDVTYAFRFTNTSQRVVTVEALNYCHHCGAPEITPSTVRPGESGAVIIDLRVAGRSGDVQAIVTIGVSGLQGKEIVLGLLAKIAPKVRVEPHRQGFGEVRIGAGGTADVRLIARAKDVSIVNARIENPYFTITPGVGRSETIKGLEHTIVPVQIGLSPHAPAGWQRAEIVLETSIGTSVSLEVTADVLPSLRVDPPDVGRGTVALGQQVKRMFAISDRDGEKLVIDSFSLAYVGRSQMESGRGGFTVNGLADVHLKMVPAADGHKAEVELAFAAPMNPGRYQVQAKFVGKGGPSDELIVPIFFEVSP